MHNKDEIQEAVDEMYKRVFMGTSNAQEGQYVLWDIIRECGFFTTNTKSMEGALALEAKKSIANKLLSKTNLSPAYKEDVRSGQVAGLMSTFQNALELGSIIATKPKQNQQKDRKNG